MWIGRLPGKEQSPPAGVANIVVKDHSASGHQIRCILGTQQALAGHAPAVGPTHALVPAGLKDFPAGANPAAAPPPADPADDQERHARDKPHPAHHFRDGTKSIYGTGHGPILSGQNGARRARGKLTHEAYRVTTFVRAFPSPARPAPRPGSVTAPKGSAEAVM
jgi:hypothetical protein